MNHSEKYLISRDRQLMKKVYFRKNTTPFESYEPFLTVNEEGWRRVDGQPIATVQEVKANIADVYPKQYEPLYQLIEGKMTPLPAYFYYSAKDMTLYMLQ